MSPEQAEMTNLDIDTRTDVYSLGVLLYELLVGAQPFDPRELREAGLVEIQRRLREDDPPRPSARISSLAGASATSASNRRVEVKMLERQLKGDLDWITMKALEKDRTRRYETPNALGLDLGRFLSSEPVRARPPSTGYLLQRFVRRNRLRVLATSIALLALLTGTTAATLGYLRATEAELTARRETETARQVSDFLTQLFRVSDPSEARGNSVTAREVLDRSREDINENLADQPEVQTTLMATMGKVYQNLGLLNEAAGLLEEALAVRRATLPEQMRGNC